MFCSRTVVFHFRKQAFSSGTIATTLWRVSSPAAETGTRARTRRAIVEAAIAVLSKSPSASLGDVAAAARVGRTTLHRYFPERSDLLTAIGREALEQVDAARLRARVDDGPADAALGRLCEEYFELGDVLTLMFTEPQTMADPIWEQDTESDKALFALVERGHAEGTIDPGLPPLWMQQVLWSLLYVAWDHVRTHGARKHDALALCLRSLRNCVAPG
jgi:AcrR family transcriptional regulator